jgi:DNA-binding beta-propeller fold protein YncE
MNLIKNFSVSLLGTSLIVLAVNLPAKALTLTYERSIGSPGFGPGQLIVPQGILVDDSTENVLVSNGRGLDRVEVYDPQGNYLKSIGSTGSGPGQFDEPADLKISPTNGNLYVGDVFNSRINIFDPEGNYVKSFAQFGGPVEGRIFFGPGGMSFDKNGNLYVTDFSNDYIQVFDQNDNLVKTIGSNGTALGQFVGPAGISVSPLSGNLFVADQYNNRIQVLTPEGEPLYAFGQPGSGIGEFKQPIGVEVDEFENVYVADSQNNRVQAFDKNGNFLFAYGEPVENPGPPPAGQPPIPTNPNDLQPGKFNWTAGLHYDKDRLYAGDFFNGRIQVLKIENRVQVPEPASLLGLGLLGLGVVITKSKTSKQRQQLKIKKS